MAILSCIYALYLRLRGLNPGWNLRIIQSEWQKATVIVAECSDDKISNIVLPEDWRVDMDGEYRVLTNGIAKVFLRTSSEEVALETAYTLHNSLKGGDE